MSSAAPFWVDVLRMKTFFQRIHTPTLGATVGTWGVTLAIIVQASFATGQPYVHAVLIAVLIALTTPVTTIFLMRAALFRARRRGDQDVPPPTAQVDNRPQPGTTAES